MMLPVQSAGSLGNLNKFAIERHWIMDTTIKTEATLDEVKRDTSGIAGHPRGLMVLFFTEFWERFSFYGLRAILMYYMIKPVTEGGVAFPQNKASLIFATYAMSVYLLALPGGFIADRFLGAKLTVLVGGAIIATGHFSMAFPSMPSFYAGLVLIAIGTGFLKPNISVMVGGLYGENDSRRDSGFSIFYSGINLGAFVSPLVCGFLAQTASFQHFLSSVGIDPKTSWHWGFGAAGVGMTFGLITYLSFRGRLAHVGLKPRERIPAQTEAQPVKHLYSVPLVGVLIGTSICAFVGTALGGLLGSLFGSSAALVGALILGSAGGLCGAITMKVTKTLSHGDWLRIGAIFVFFLFSIIFWGVYEQAPTTLSLFADKFTRNEVFGKGFPPSYYQTLQAVFVIILSPVFGWIWIRLGRREPSSPAKFSYGLFFIALSILLMVPASMLAASGPVSPIWLVAVYFISVVGELCLSPVGLSTVTKLAPARLVGIMMGVWFVSIALGDFIAGFMSRFFSADTAILVRLFGLTGVAVLIAMAILALMTPGVRRLMGKVH